MRKPKVPLLFITILIFGVVFNRILIYNTNNRYLGCYTLEMKGELPVKIKGNELVFSVQTEDKLKLQTRISFVGGLPSQIEIRGDNLYHLVIN